MRHLNKSMQYAVFTLYNAFTAYKKMYVSMQTKMLLICLHLNVCSTYTNHDVIGWNKIWTKRIQTECILLCSYQMLSNDRLMDPSSHVQTDHFVFSIPVDLNQHLSSHMNLFQSCIQVQQLKRYSFHIHYV